MAFYVQDEKAITAAQWNGSNLDEIRAIAPTAFQVGTVCYFPTNTDPLHNIQVDIDSWVFTVDSDPTNPKTVYSQRPQQFQANYTLAES